MTAAKTRMANRRIRVKVKSPPPIVKSASPKRLSLPFNTAVDFRMYDPTNRKYFRPRPFKSSSSPPRQPPTPTPSRSSSSLLSGVRCIDAEHSTHDSPYATSHTQTLYQVDEQESPFVEGRFRPTLQAFETDPGAVLWLTDWLSSGNGCYSNVDCDIHDGHHLHSIPPWTNSSLLRFRLRVHHKVHDPSSTTAFFVARPYICYLGGSYNQNILFRVILVRSDSS